MCPYHRAEGAYRKAARALGIEEDQVLYSCADEFAGAVAPPSIFAPNDVERWSEPHGPGRGRRSRTEPDRRPPGPWC